MKIDWIWDRMLEWKQLFLRRFFSVYIYIVDSIILSLVARARLCFSFYTVSFCNPLYLWYLCSSLVLQEIGEM